MWISPYKFHFSVHLSILCADLYLRSILLSTSRLESLQKEAWFSNQVHNNTQFAVLNTESLLAIFLGRDLDRENACEVVWNDDYWCNITLVFPLVR